ncbi:hypothetical protein [Paraflavitalea sp. CAU 1676]|uniref:hypothetical protein n=1 Tax=Paraflavitalea sp. CAU 1676 TaxID=3032598 RepID=UPI0023DB7803|nr:hypothetical protein [Paraflavitalea sp. CAU 1676]MDF2192191.1 hypothetical protein [Paraflavitalea sp. CAU 1676]
MNATIGTVVTAGTTSRGNGFSYFNGVKNLMIVGIMLLGLIACRKDKDKPGEETGDKELVVSFVSGSIDQSLVDSAFVILKKAGSAQQTFKRFEKKAGTLSFYIEDLSAGSWTAEMYVFARFNASGGRRYKQEKAFVVPTGGIKNSITLNAPTGSITDAWKSYAFFRYVAEGISVSVPIDASNPHFDVEVGEAKWNHFYIERYANNRLTGGANAKVAEQIWDCTSGCYTSDRFINNSTAFLPFVQEVGNKEWNNGLIIVVVGAPGGLAVQFSHSYNK